MFPPTFRGKASFSGQFAIRHRIEHDLHHGGELSLVLGTHGLTGVTIGREARGSATALPGSTARELGWQDIAPSSRAGR